MMSTFFVFKTKVNPHTIGRSKSCHLKTSPFLTDYSSEHTTCLDKTSNLYTLKEDPLWMLDEQHQKAWGGRGGGGSQIYSYLYSLLQWSQPVLKPQGDFLFCSFSSKAISYFWRNWFHAKTSVPAEWPPQTHARVRKSYQSQSNSCWPSEGSQCHLSLPGTPGTHSQAKTFF